MKLTNTVRHTLSAQQPYDYPNNSLPNRGLQLARTQLFFLITFIYYSCVYFNLSTIVLAANIQIVLQTPYSPTIE